MEANKTKKGVQEWASKSVNLQYGCENNCRYCYAKKMATRFNRVPPKGWDQPVIDPGCFEKTLPKNKRVMFPTTHDISPHNAGDCLVMIKTLLRRGNSVLIVSKPRLACIDLICKSLATFDIKPQDHLEFRFTIGSVHNEVLQYWEPNAPLIEERMQCVELALNAGYQVSVSCEPLLDPLITQYEYLPFVPLIERLGSYISESGAALKEIWIGAMNYIHNAPSLDYAAIYTIYHQNPKLKWKDSFRKHLPESVFDA